MNKESIFKELVQEASECTRCPQMCGRSAVLSPLNGRVDARIMFIGEAPGRKGADRTRVPFSGDQSGQNFDRYLASIRLTRDEIFITSAALCNPRTASGANRKPSTTELINCSDFLRRTLKVIDPLLVVTLGSVALDSLKHIEPHPLTLRDDVGKIVKWNGRLLIPIYHPSPQVLASHRRERQQMQDYGRVATALEQLRQQNAVAAR